MHSEDSRVHNVFEEEKEIEIEIKQDSDENKEMNVEDDDELNCPNPKIHTLQKSQASFVPLDCLQSQTDRRGLLREAFTKYAETSIETGIVSLKSRQFLKLLQDSGIIGSKVTKSEAEIIYSSHTKGKRGFMNYETFLMTLVKVAELMYPELVQEKRSRALERLIAEYFLPLQEKAPSPSKYTEVFADIPYDENTKELLISILPILKDIYDVYFGNPFKAVKDFKQIVKTSTKQLMVFLREFGLIQNYTQKTVALNALEQLVHTSDELLTNSEDIKTIFDEPGQDYGCYFTLARFFVFLLWIAVISFDTIRSDSSQYTNTEKLFFLLAKMELSAGFANLYKDIPKNTSMQYTLVPPLEVLIRVIQNNPLNDEISKGEENLGSKDAVRIKKLHKLFMWYCSLNDNSGGSSMTISKYLTLLKDAHVPISSTDAELVFTKVLGPVKKDKSNSSILIKSSRGSKQSKMDFNKFYQAMSIIAKKVYPELNVNDALSELISKEMRVIEERNKNISKSTELLKDTINQLQHKEVKEVLKDMNKLLKPYFDTYTEHKGKMRYETFIKFSRDFSIFPDLCSKVMLHGNFHALALSIDTKEYLDSERFINALGLCAIQSKGFDKDNDSIERILHVLEKIVQSPGAHKVKLSKTPLNDIDPLMSLRKKYKKYFDIKVGNSTKEVLDEVLGEDSEITL